MLHVVIFGLIPKLISYTYILFGLLSCYAKREYMVQPKDIAMLFEPNIFYGLWVVLEYNWVVFAWSIYFMCACSSSVCLQGTYVCMYIDQIYFGCVLYHNTFLLNPHWIGLFWKISFPCFIFLSKNKIQNLFAQHEMSFKHKKTSNPHRVIMYIHMYLCNCYYVRVYKGCCL